ncbi:MAG TPA: hypothetical protein VK612_12265 [Pyrinomonadaceae bacterium]|nr:hypothetical protein [Pyrinomonadaceae bacterium]
MYTYFLIAQPEEIAGLRTESDVLSFIENLQTQIGGFYSRERIDYLSSVFLKEERRSLATSEKLEHGSQFFQIDSKLVKQVAAAGQDELLDASVPWDEGAWQNAEVNRMDLAGFLLEFAELCKTAVAGDKNVYFVLVEE